MQLPVRTCMHMHIAGLARLRRVHLSRHPESSTGQERCFNFMHCTTTFCWKLDFLRILGLHNLHHFLCVFVLQIKAPSSTLCTSKRVSILEPDSKFTLNIGDRPGPPLRDWWKDGAEIHFSSALRDESEPFRMRFSARRPLSRSLATRTEGTHGAALNQFK